MRTSLMREVLGLLVLGGIVFSPGFLSAQGARSPLMNLPAALEATPGCLGVELATTASGKQVIFAWFENKKAALAWYYSQTHQMLMKMSGAPGRPHGPLADVPDDGRPIMAIASLVLARPQNGVPENGLPPVSQIAIELYAPLPGGLAAGGRFAPMAVQVPGLIHSPRASLSPAK